MTRSMSFRGPDDSGVWIREHVALGHRRLAVIDIAGGVQPMTAQTAGGTVAMVYSGEVYNYQELRIELIRRGHRFATASDTDVVLHAYLEWGEAVAEHLNGMFAFAVWGERCDKLVLVRDRLGIKPLYYYPTRDGGLLFGSEPKAIFAHPDVDGREKSLLRAAAAHVLPPRVAWRRKSGYPTIQDPSYSTALQQQAKELLTEPNHPLFDLFNRDWLYKAVHCDPAAMRRRTRLGLDWALGLYHWFDIYRPQLVLE